MREIDAYPLSVYTSETCLLFKNNWGGNSELGAFPAVSAPEIYLFIASNTSQLFNFCMKSQGHADVSQNPHAVLSFPFSPLLDYLPLISLF